MRDKLESSFFVRCFKSARILIFGDVQLSSLNLSKDTNLNKGWPSISENLLTQWADLSGLEPSGDAMEVEGVVAHSPGHGTLFTGVGHLVGLALDA